MKIVKKILIVVFAVSFGLFCLFFPVEVKNGAGEGLNRCISVIIPSLYAMMTASAILLDSGALSTVGRWISPVTNGIFGLNGELAAIFFFSLVAGYPVGAKMIYTLYINGRLPKRMAEILSGLCYGSGTAFIFGCVAPTGEIGRLILLSNIAAEFLVLLILSPYFRRNTIEEKSRSIAVNGDILTKSVSSSGRALGEMCLCVIIFAVFAEMAEYCGLSQIFGCDLYKAFLDVTAINDISADITVKSALVSFGGVCVFFQISAIFREKLSIIPLVIMRSFAAVSSFFICRILEPYFIGGAVDVFASGERLYRENSPVPSVMLIIMTGVVVAEMAKIQQKQSVEQL
ncbi:MAG: hypothetical protein IKJ60_00685 [Ruminococcus sp.]|nr:hypothetical protein [Ruminococcus sp.]